jgi:hypothetical protein
VPPRHLQTCLESIDHMQTLIIEWIKYHIVKNLISNITCSNTAYQISHIHSLPNITYSNTPNQIPCVHSLLNILHLLFSFSVFLDVPFRSSDILCSMTSNICHVIWDKSLLYIYYITPTSKFSLFFRRCVEIPQRTSLVH